MSSKTATDRPTGLQAIREYFRDFKILKDNPREYWGMQIINVVDSLGYFALLTVVTLFLSYDLGLDDENAGYVAAFFLSSVTILLMFTGLVTDWLGIRWSLNAALFLRAGVTLAIGLIALGPAFEGRGWVVAGLFFILAPSLAMVQTVFQVGTKRYTTKRSRSSGYNLWYLFMNLGAFGSGIAVDLLRTDVKPLEAGGEEVFSSTWVILLGVATSVICLAVSFLMIRSEAQAHGPDEEPAEEQAQDAAPVRRKPLENLKALVAHTAFWRFLVLVGATLGVRAVYVYMYMLLPKYWIRVIGPDAKIGLLNTINPALIVGGLILFIPIAHRFNLFKMLVFGAILSSLSLFVLMLPWQWLSSDVATAYYTMAILCMVFVSLGEVFWSPKLYEYTAAIAPPGQEGIYLGMSMMPWFIAKTIVSALSGHMLTQWCPEGTGEAIRNGTITFWHSPEAMWLILGIWAIAGPLLAWVFRGWLTRGTDFAIGSGVAKPAVEGA